MVQFILPLTLIGLANYAIKRKLQNLPRLEFMIYSFPIKLIHVLIFLSVMISRIIILFSSNSWNQNTKLLKDENLKLSKMKDRNAQKRVTDPVIKAKNQSSTELNKEGNDQNKIRQRSESIPKKQHLDDKEKDVCISIEYCPIIHRTLFYIMYTGYNLNYF